MPDARRSDEMANADLTNGEGDEQAPAREDAQAEDEFAELAEEASEAVAANDDSEIAGPNSL